MSPNHIHKLVNNFNGERVNSIVIISVFRIIAFNLIINNYAIFIIVYYKSKNSITFSGPILAENVLFNYIVYANILFFENGEKGLCSSFFSILFPFRSQSF